MLDPVYKNRQIADQKLDGLLWELEDSGVVNFTVTINDDWSSVGTNWM